MDLDNFLDWNLVCLSQRQPQLAAHLRGVGLSSVELFASAKGFPTARYKRSDGTIVPLHSRYNPMQEARQALKKIDIQGADYFILLGFGLGYNLDALVEIAPSPDYRFFVVESDLEILRAALQARDLRALLKSRLVHFAWPSSGPELAAQWAEFFDPVRAQKSVFINHVPCLAVGPDLFKSAVQTIQSQTYQIFTDINTLVIKSKVFLDNFVENYRDALEAPGVEVFRGQFAGIPAIVISAGPSLDRNIHELRGREQQALILATDTTVKPLLAAGVKPHFVLSGDPTRDNYLHLRGATPAEFLLVAEATCFPEVFREFRGRTIACTYENSALRSLSVLLGRKGTLRAWGSVATMALDYALLLGCNPVIFVGQDLAHSDGRTYCSGLYWQEERFSNVSNPDQWRERWQEIRAGKKTVTMLDIFGHPVETTDKLAAYWNWFNAEIRSHPDIQFINATEGGILREGVTVLSLREALHRFASRNFALSEKAGALFRQASQPETHGVEEILAALKRESATIRALLARGLEFCAEESFGARSRDLEAIQKSLHGNRQLIPLLDSFNQMGNIAFLRSRAQLESLSKDENPALLVRNSYGAYFESVLQALEIVDSALARL